MAKNNTWKGETKTKSVKYEHANKFKTKSHTKSKAIHEASMSSVNFSNSVSSISKTCRYCEKNDLATINRVCSMDGHDHSICNACHNIAISHFDKAIKRRNLKKMNNSSRKIQKDISRKGERHNSSSSNDSFTLGNR